MKAIIILLIGGLLGAVTMRLYEQREAERHSSQIPPVAASEPVEKNPSVADNTKNSGENISDRIHDKLLDWHLTSDDIKDDLTKTGQVVRTNAQIVGGKIADARIVTVIKAKYALDHDLSAIDISVDAQNGEVALGGTVTSPELVGKAIILALDTDGVRGVTSKISVATK